MWYSGWYTIIVLADNYWAGLGIVILFNVYPIHALPIFLFFFADNYWATESTKITLLVTNFFQEHQQNSRRFPAFPGVVDTL